MSNDNGNGNGKRKRGRPPGSGRVAQLTKWQPKEWLPIYEQAVALSCAGWTNIDIAATLGYTKEHVSLILTTPQAAAIRRQVLETLHQRVIDTVPDRMNAIAVKSLERLHKVIHDDDIFRMSPFAVVDRGIKVLQSLGHMRKESEGGSINVDKAVILTSKDTADLFEGLRRAEEVKKLHTGYSEPAELNQYDGE